jgi:hypothetical protein
MRQSLSLLALIALILPFVAAFTNTAPFLAFTSRQSALLDRGLPSRSAASPAVVPRDITKSLTSKVEELCNFDAMVIVEIDDVSLRDDNI